MIRFIDLFAGLGGIRLGFTQAAEELGLQTECVFTSEIKESALEAMRYNFKNPDLKKIDITETKETDIPPFNILLGGFPCQAFSFAGKQMGLCDTRGTLFFEIQRILEFHLKNVDGFLLENVEGLITHQKENKTDLIGKTLSIILDVLRNKLSYNADYILLDSSDFGVPQSRKRVYIVGCKKKYGKVNLDFKPIPKVGVGEFLDYGQECISTPFTKSLLSHFTTSELEGKFLKDKRGGQLNIHSWDFEYKGDVSEDQKELLNLLFKNRRRRSWAEKIGIEWMDGMPLTAAQISTFYSHPKLQKLLDDLVKKQYLSYEHPKKKIIHTTTNGQYSERVPDTSLAKGYNIVTGKLSFPMSSILDPKKPAPTIVAMDMSHIGVVDGNGLRYLTLKEGLRLFGYPESYSLDIFNDTKKGQQLGYDLLGNSVCVPVIKEVAKKLLTQIYC